MKKSLKLFFMVFVLFLGISTTQALTVSESNLLDGMVLKSFDYDIEEDTTVTDICNMPEYRKPMKIVGMVINFAKIIVPIIIIGFGVMDLYKAITSSKDDGIKKAVKSIVVRVVAGVAIFLLPGLIQFVLNWVNEWSDYENSWCCCTDCLLNPDCDTNACNSNSCRIEGMN